MNAPTHPRPLELERLAMGEPSAASAHVASCAECASQVAALETAARAFVTRQPPRVFLEDLERRRPPSWKRWVLGLVPVAAALVLTLVLTGRDGGEVRLKGGGLQVVVTRNERTWVLLSDERPRAGDRLSFFYEAPSEGHLLLLDVERGKAPSAFFPFQADASGAVTRGSNALPDGVALDDTRADEWLLMVFSPRALRVSDVVSELDGGLPRFTCPGCMVEVRTLTRERR